jgi:hypothetical protein
MKITTTCIGAYPKPGYIEIGNFAETQDQDGSATRAFTYTHDTADQAAEELLIKATQAAIQDQLDCGIDEVPADVTRVMHMCCGYPGHVDDEDYLKAAPRFRLDDAWPQTGDGQTEEHVRGRRSR